MKDEGKTKKQLLDELKEMRQQMARLEAVEAEHFLAQEGLKKAEQEKQAILDSLVEHVVYHDPEMRMLWANRAACHSAGMAREELIGRYCYEIWSKRSDPCEDCPVKRAGETGEPQEIEKTTPDGRSWFIQGSPVRDSNGDIVGMVEFTLDISKRKQAEEALQKAHDELERRVDERTAQLLEANEQLKREMRERERAEEALRREKEKYRILVEESPLGVSIIGKDGHYEYTNPKFVEIFGYGLEDIPTGREWFARAYPEEEYRKLAIAAWITDLRDSKRGEARPRTFTVTCEDGSEKTIQFRAVTMEDGDHFVIYEDITERTRIEEALRQNEETLKAILAASPVGIGLVRNRILDWTNKAMYRIWGYEEGSLLGQSVEALYPNDEEYERVGHEFYLGIEEGGIGQIETRWLTKDGRLIDCYLQGSPLDSSDLSRGVIVAAMDITDRKRAEEKLRESEERYRSLVDNIAVGVSLISPKMEILTLNKQMKEWFPEIDPETRPLCYRSFIDPPRDEVCSYCPTIQTLRDGEVHEAITETPAGNEIKNYRIISSPVKDREGQVVGAIESVEDITERKQAQEQLLTYQQQLRSLASELVLTEERERRRLATALHDSVGQFLAISKIKVDALRNDTSAAEFAGHLNEIGQLTGQAIQQTRSLTFDLSPPVLYELGLEAALEALAERMRQQHPICIEFAHDRNPKSLSEDLAVLLYRAVRELLINIVKHARANNARTSIETGERELRITVEDDGAGFDISEIDSLDNRVGKFGLFSIRERLHHLGGRFEIASKPGQGTHVTLVAPFGPDY